MVYHAVREAPTYQNVIYQLTATSRGAGSMGHGGGARALPPLSIMAGHGGHNEQNIKQEIAKYFLS